MTSTTAAAAPSNNNANSMRTMSSTLPPDSYHSSLRKLKNGERMILFRNNSLKRSFKKVNNDSSYFPHNNPHHCTIELKTKAASCLHLFNKTPPMILSTFRNQEGQNEDDQQNNELLWQYQYDISKAKLAAHSQCNLNNTRHTCHPPTPPNNAALLMAEAKFSNSLENKTIL